MRRRILSLLLTLCLIVGLLPAVALPHAHAEGEAKKEMVRVMGYTDMEAWTDGRSTYAVNVPVDCSYTVTKEDGSTETVTFQGTQWKLVATATKTEPEEWNLKFSWEEGGTPTLTLKGAILDYYDEDAGKYSTHFSADAYKYAIASKEAGDVLDLKIVIAENSYIATPLHVVGECAAYADIIIESVGDAKLTSRSVAGIASKKNLILNNANLDLEVPKYGKTYRPLYAPSGGITFNGGNYRLYSTTVGGSSNSQGAVGSLIYAGAGDIVINDGTFDLHTGYYSTSAMGAIHNASSAASGYTIKINGGEIVINHRNVNAFHSNNVTQITGGEIYATGTSYSLNKTNGYVKMTGGSLELWRPGGGAYYGASYIDLSEHPCWTGTWGTYEGATGSFTDLNTTQRYINIVAHKQLAAVEAVAPDCVNDGAIAHFNCSKCGKNFADAEAKTELETIVDPATGIHAAGDPVKENVTDPDCTTGGSYDAVTYCTGCGVEMDRVPMGVEPTGHTGGEIVKENEVPADCVNGGTYEAVVYCADCGVELSRVTMETEALGHTEVEVKKVDATPEAAGHEAGTKCSVCGEILSGCEVIPKHLVEMIRVDGYDDIKASTDGRCAYLVNEPTEMTDTDGNTFMGSTWKVVGNWTWTEPAEWNVKYSFTKGGVPTLTLKGAILDHYNDATGKFSTAAAAYHNAILGKTFQNEDVYDLHIIIEEDSTINTNGTMLGDGGGVYFHNVTITSVGDAKLTARGNKGFAAKNGSLTLNNVNLDLYVPHYNGGYSYPLNARDDLIINGGTYKISSPTAGGANSWAGSAGSLIRSEAGDVIINGGTFELVSNFYSQSNIGVIHATGGGITINDGTFNIQHGLANGMYSVTGAVMNGGTIVSSGDIYFLPKTNGHLKMNGGSLQMYNANNAAIFEANYLDVSDYPGCVIMAGNAADGSDAVKQDAPIRENYLSIAPAPACDHTNTTTTEEIIAAATCTTAGSKKVIVTCECGEVISEEIVEIKALGHTEKTDVETKDATCTEAGYTKTTVTCTVCGETISETVEEIKALGHTEKTNVETVDATCTTAGSVKTTVICEVCGETISETTEEIKALGHTEKTDVETKAATCTEAGYTKTTVTCTVCGETISETTEEIKALGHTEAEAVVENFVDSDLNNKGSYDSVVYCSVCNAELKRETIVIDEKTGATAEANGVKYYTLAEAVAVGGEVKLLADVTLDAPIVIEKGKTVVLDLGIYKISYTSTVMGEAMITNRGTLTINGEEGSEIYYNYTGAADPSYGKGNYTISNGGTLTVNGGKIYIANLRTHAKYPIDNNSTTGDAVLVINGGHLYNYNTSAIRQFCNSTTNKNSVTINGGLIEGYSAIWMQNPGKNTVKGDLTINGGEIRTTAAAYVNGSAALKDVSSHIYATSEGGVWSEDSFAAFNGGIFNENVDVTEAFPKYTFSDAAVFNGRPPHIHNFVATYTEPTFEADGFWTYACECGKDSYTVVDEGSKKIAVATANGELFETLAEAVAVGGEVKLLADVALETGIVIASGKTVTIDLNGFNITMTTGDVTTTTALITNKGNLTITDSVGEGEICLTYTGARNGNVSISTIRNESILNIAGGTVNCISGNQAISYAIDNFGTVNISGGAVIGGASNYCIRMFLASTTQDNVLNVTGGTVYYVWAQNTNANANKATINITGGTVYYVYIAAANSVACDVSNITLNAKADCVPYGVTVVSDNEDYFLENVDGVYQISYHTCSFATETFDATCTKDGKIVYTCTCGETYEEVIPAKGHTEEIIPAKDATCGATGLTEGKKCSVCGEVLVAQEETPATGNHTYDNANDTTCNGCGYVRVVEPTFVVDEDNNLVVVDPNADHIYHRVTVFYLGDKTVTDINLVSQLSKVDPNAKTYWGIDSINAVQLLKEGNYVIHLYYNTAGSPKITVAKQFAVKPIITEPEFAVESGKVTVTDNSAYNVYHRVTVYYLNNKSVANIYDVNALKAIDASAKTYWGLSEINKIQLLNSGKYVLHLDYNHPGSDKITIAKEVTLTASKPTISRDNYTLKVTDKDESHKYHRVTVYFIGNETVDIYDEAALKALDPTARTHWGLAAINKVQMAVPGTYVIYLSYNLANGLKQTMIVKATTRMPVPGVWLEENGQIGTYVPVEVVHRNYEIYYLGDQTVEDIYDIAALKAIDADPIKFDNQKQIAERGVLTEKGNYVLVMYYNYSGSARQIVAEFATLK